MGTEIRAGTYLTRLLAGLSLEGIDGPVLNLCGMAASARFHFTTTLAT